MNSHSIVSSRSILTGLVAGATVGLAAQSAAGVVAFSFADRPDPGGQFIYTAPTSPGMLGSLVYDSNVRVKLYVDATGEGGSLFWYQDAIFHFTAGVGSVAPVAGASDVWIAPLTLGSMDFQDSGGNLLFSGAFGDELPAALVLVMNTGSVNASLELGGLNYVGGDTLLADLGSSIAKEVTGLVPPFDGVWTLSNMTTLKTVMVPVLAGDRSSQVFLGDFSANSSYSGTAGITVIPGPGTSCLAGIALLTIVSRRRR